MKMPLHRFASAVLLIAGAVWCSPSVSADPVSADAAVIFTNRLLVTPTA